MTLSVDKQDCYFIDKKTESRILILMEKDMSGGSAVTGNFLMQKVIEDHDLFYGEHCLRNNYTSLFEIEKTKHAYVFSGSGMISECETFLDFKELSKSKYINQKTFYVLPVLENGEDDYDTIMSVVGIDVIMSWFDSEDPFMSIFNGIHKVLGNNPEDFIY